MDARRAFDRVREIGLEAYIESDEYLAQKEEFYAGVKGMLDYLMESAGEQSDLGGEDLIDADECGAVDGSR